VNIKGFTNGPFRLLLSPGDMLWPTTQPSHILLTLIMKRLAAAVLHAFSCKLTVLRRLP